MFPEVHTTSHRGIPVRWADLPGPVTGTLIFGVGHRDEPAELMGITHLIEHLAFRALEPITLQTGGVVTDESVSFFATGEPAAVAQFLNDICRALGRLGDVTTKDLKIEKSVLEVETGTTYPTAGLLTYRYGLGGIGNANAHHAGHHALTPAELANWSATWLTAANAALTFTSAVPTELDIALPQGTRPERWTGKPVITTPCLIESGKVGVAASLLVDTALAFELGEALRHASHHRLRHELGLVYSPDVFYTRIDGRSTQVDVILDPDAEHVPRVVEETLTLLRRLAAEGFSEEVITTVRCQWLTSLAWVNAEVGSYLDGSSAAALLGVPCPTPQDVLERAESFTGQQLRAALTQSLDSLLIAFDGDESLDKEWVTSSGLEYDRFDPWDEGLDLPEHRGRRWHGKLRGEASRVQLSLHGGLLITQSRHGTGAIRLSDLAVVGHCDCGCLQLIDFRGRYAVVDPDDWYRGKSMTKAILAGVRPEIVRRFPSQ